MNDLEYQIALRVAFKLPRDVSQEVLDKIMLTEGRLFKLCDGPDSCETWKSVGEFHHSNRSTDGFDRRCRECINPTKMDPHEAQGRAIAAGALERKEAREALAKQSKCRELAEKMGYWEEDPL